MCNRIASSMRNEVGRYVKEKLATSASKNATGEFSRDSGGISDPNMFESEVHILGDTVELNVKSTAPPQPSIFDTPINSYPGMFSEWIEYGEWLDVFHYLDTGEKVNREARPFFDPVEQELNANPSAIEGLIEKYLK